MCKFLTKGVNPGPIFDWIFTELEKTPEASPSARLSATLYMLDRLNPFWQVRIGGINGVPILFLDYVNFKQFHISKKDFTTNLFGRNLIKGVRYFSEKHRFRKSKSLQGALKELTSCE